MERIALQKLIEWNNNKRKKPLIVWGARQVGKTYLIQELFAKEYYKNNYLYIDCKKEDEIREFCSQTANAEKIIEYISLRKGFQITEKTLLIFDEVQECPNIISSLKYFCQDFREIPVIATGSMVRIKLQRETHKKGARNTDKFLFPVGKINQITIYPMTFDEFLMNSNKMLYNAIKTAYENKQPLDTQIHELALDQVYKYLLVGGMPEAVEAYIDDHNLLESREILKVLYDNYLADMELYQASQESILRSRVLFQNIYKELHDDLGCYIPNNGYLKKWADQGVLLLNTVLTVRAHQANSHQGHGWEQFTDAVIEAVNAQDRPIVIFLWGSPAQKKAKMLTNPKHLVLKCPHPSPLSAYRGFFGCKHFSKANEFLKANGIEPIDWQIENI